MLRAALPQPFSQQQRWYLTRRLLHRRWVSIRHYFAVAVVCRSLKPHRLCRISTKPHHCDTFLSSPCDCLSNASLVSCRHLGPSMRTILRSSLQRAEPHRFAFISPSSSPNASALFCSEQRGRSGLHQDEDVHLGPVKVHRDQRGGAGWVQGEPPDAFLRFVHFLYAFDGCTSLFRALLPLLLPSRSGWVARAGST